LQKQPPSREPGVERRKPGPQPRFTREALARRALAILDEHGTETLTMRTLADELGMGTMALYRYFPSKDALMDAAVDLAAGEVELPVRAGESGSWKEQLAELARALFAAGLRHPILARERFSRPLQSPGALHITDRAVGLLLDAGLSNEDAVAAFKALLIHTLGAAWFASSESRTDVRRGAAERHGSVSADELPAMAAVADEFTAALGGPQAFTLGLDALLDGIELRARRARAPRPPRALRS
jgi:AcrR family transcriptional regulator